MNVVKLCYIYLEFPSNHNQSVSYHNVRLLRAKNFLIQKCLKYKREEKQNL